MAEAGALPFDLLAIQSMARVAIRMLVKNHGNTDLPIVHRTSEMLVEPTGLPLPAISLRTRLTDRSWYNHKPDVRWEIKSIVKAGDPPEIVCPIVQEFLHNYGNHHRIVYTDGSKSNEGVGAGIYNENQMLSIGLPQQCSVFSAEAFAIKSAITSNANCNQLLILLDSASYLLAIETGKSQHPWIQDIENLMRNRRIQLCWIPGHAGIHGNEEADRLAGEAGRSNARLNIAIPGEDAVKSIKAENRHQWEIRWAQSTEVKLREIKSDTTKWPDCENTLDQRVLTRLRIGHTRLTHEFLLKKSSPPMCECCGTVIDVRHIILHCRKFDDARKKYKIESNSLRTALCNDSESEKQLMNYLKETNVYKKL
ncbi:uncharacterized protein LOC129717049 [Wyeomyia smithii]|uniref:uncharacterized protein LOC129717049 n=1 Tax=Wyeomyia smithii TaxID=174621 RepID=UPI002467B9C8|nr:uncharacterized protein LOC129717049 [Wyeomyia smithii]